MATPAFAPDPAPLLGVDIACFPDLDPRLSLISGQQNLFQAILHRLQSLRGSLNYDPDYGDDLRRFLNDSVNTLTTDQTAKIAQAVEVECLKDERIQACNCTATLDPILQQLAVGIQIDTKDSPFVLVLAITAVSTTVMQGN